MSARSNSDIDISSRALVLIGANPITSFEDGSTEATVASNMYEDIAQAALLNTRWRFTTDQAVMNRLSEEPTGRYDAAYQIPSASIMAHAVTINDNPIQYQIYGNKVYCDAGISDELVIDYSYRSHEVDWPAYFILAVEYSLASIFAVAIARDTSLANMFEQKALMAMAKARGLDAQQHTNLRLNTSRFINQRRS